ncbi:DUF397 domain-containing protein [Streptomyces virginiae]|uniref:DUF397 domain-containing protein n=1 Tax=Streptomyces virginiae TaxID=1961 RepID=UPI0036B1BEF5
MPAGSPPSQPPTATARTSSPPASRGRPHGGVAVRDSKNPSGPAIVFDMTTFIALVTTIQDGRFAI